MRQRRTTVQPFLDVRTAVLNAMLEQAFRRRHHGSRPPLVFHYRNVYGAGSYVRRSASPRDSASMRCPNDKDTPMETRRSFIRRTSAGLGALLMGGTVSANAQAGPPLIDQVAALCRRLAPLGWRQMMFAVTGGALDVTAPDLARELAKPVQIDRNYPGFGDFALAGTRAIEPGRPDESLLYHALAALTVVSAPTGDTLGGFPTVAEIETVENYVYAARSATLDALQAAADGFPVAVVTFALHYRNAPDSVSGKHAQLCFSRTGIARIGDLEPFYDPARRCFAGLDPSRPYSFRVVPARFAPFLAVRMPGRAGGFGPQDPLASDADRQFWVPLHKLFGGPECIAGLNLHVSLSSGLRNDLIAAFHRFLEFQGFRNNYYGDVLKEYPFTIENTRIAELSSRPDYGAGVLVPHPEPFIQEATFQGRPLTFPVDPAFTGEPANIQMSSPMVLPGLTGSVTEPNYFDDAAQETRRPAPQYVNARHAVENGHVVNLNDRPDLMKLLARGDFDALHYVDTSGDGWMVADCLQLQQAGLTSIPAFCMVGLPDFLPNVTQRDLMLWSRHDVPEPLRPALWAIPPYALSRTRIAADVELPVGFDINDDTVTAIVSQPEVPDAAAQSVNGPYELRKVGLPDGSTGVFDPGWDTSLGTRSDGPTHTLKRYLAGHGLGSPFIEDAKLCAALGSYWPAAAPDATREYEPNKPLSGILYPWPSIVPLTDTEIGMVPTPDGKLMSWDGVPGPQRRQVGDRTVVAYHDALHVDYIDRPGTMTAALTARIDATEYKARILAMAAVYWSLRIHPRPGKTVNDLLRAKSAWAVLSFRHVSPEDAGVDAAASAAQGRLEGPHRYAIDIYRWGAQTPDPADFKIILVEVLEEVHAFTDGRVVLVNRRGTWHLDNSIPT